MSEEDRVKIEQVLGRVSSMLEAEGLTHTKSAVDRARLVMGFEASGWRIPKCGSCHAPLSDLEKLARINRDREAPA